MQWKPRSQAANHGYSHGSGIASTSNASRCRQSLLRPCRRDAGRRRLAGVAVEPAAHVVRVHLLAPDEPGARLAQDPHLLGGGAGRRERRVELVGVGLARGDDLVERGAGPVGSSAASLVAGRCSRSRSSALPPAATVTR